MIQMEKYWVNKKTYLIWDPIRNQIELNEKRITEVRKGSLTFGAQGIIYGPYMEENKVQYRFYQFDESEMEETLDIKRVFRQYLMDSNYDNYSNVRFKKECNQKLGEKGECQEEKGRLRAIGCVYVNQNLISDLGDNSSFSQRQII